MSCEWMGASCFVGHEFYPLCWVILEFPNFGGSAPCLHNQHTTWNLEVVIQKPNSMGAVSLLLATSLQSYHFPSSTQTHLPNFAASSQLLSFAPKSTNFRTKTVVFGNRSANENDSQFLDENGVVDDMDGYLNYHSFEYDSVWDTKPSWSAFHFPCFFYHHFYSRFLILLFHHWFSVTI